MSTTDERTSIPVDKSIRDELFQLKQSSTDSYNDVLKRLIEGEQ
jgi:predicted CopG family antitoxin